MSALRLSLLILFARNIIHRAERPNEQGNSADGQDERQERINAQNAVNDADARREENRKVHSKQEQKDARKFRNGLRAFFILTV